MFIAIILAHIAAESQVPYCEAVCGHVVEPGDVEEHVVRDGVLPSAPGWDSVVLSVVDGVVLPPVSGGDGVLPSTSGRDGVVLPPPAGGDEVALPPASGGDGVVLPPLTGGDGVVLPPASGEDGIILPPAAGEDDVVLSPTSGIDGLVLFTSNCSVFNSNDRVPPSGVGDDMVLVVECGVPPAGVGDGVVPLVGASAGVDNV